MKTCLRPLLVYAAVSSIALSQGIDLTRSDDMFADADIGPHHRVVQWTTTEPDADGNLVEVPNRYIELATGLNWWNPLSQTWEPTIEAFEITPKGYAVAVQGQHKLILAPNINEGGSVDLELPDGQRLRSNPMGLSYFDASSGKNVLLAEVKDCVGELVTPNVVIYFGCFDRIKGALRYTYTRSGMEQDVILLENIGSPALYGLDPDTTRLEIYTEFFDPPSPQKAVRNGDWDATPGKVDEVLGTERVEEGLGAADAEEGFPDEELSFGSMAMGPGVAYLLNDTMEPVPVAKQWLETEDGRKFLSESVPYRDVEEPLKRIADPGAAIPRLDASSLAQRTVEGRKALTGLLAKRVQHDGQEMMVAGIRPGQWRGGSGLVLDYTTVITGQTNYVLKGDETYYVTGPTYLYGSTTVEAGTIVKYTNANSPTLYFQGAVDFQTTPYRPAVFTAKDDNTVGETIVGSTGSPTGTYANVAIRFYSPPVPVDLHHVRVAYAYMGAQFYYKTMHQVRHCQFVRCHVAVYTYGTTTLSVALQNVLVQGGAMALYLDGSSSTATGEHLTLHDLNRVAIPANRFWLTNSLLQGITNWDYAFYGANNVTNSGTTAFQQVGEGLHYLASGSPYRNAGTTNISPKLLAELRHLTTYPPTVLSNDFTTSTTLSPQAQRDTDAPDLGYHYDPLDYCWSALNLTNGATLTLTNGVAVGLYGNKGTILRSGTAFISEGQPQALNRLARYTSVQEGTNVWGPPATSANPVLELAASTPAQARLTFTDIPFMADGKLARQIISGCNSYAVSPLALSHCQLRGAYLSLANTTSGYNNYFCWTNNLIERCNLYFLRADSYTPTYVNLFNNLFTKGVHSFTVGYYTAPWIVKDNLFDSDTLTNSGTATFTNSNNGYRANLAVLRGSSGNDKTNLTVNFVSVPATESYGVLRGYYYPTDGAATNLSALLDAGSRSAAEVGLYHFSARVDQAKETNSMVDIGYHYVAAGRDVAAAPTAGLVAHWKLDDGSGTTATNSVPLGSPGTLFNGPAWTSGPAGGALCFDGSNDYLQATNTQALIIEGDKTVAFWMKKNAETVGYGQIVGKGSSDYSYRGYHFWDDLDGNARLLWQQGYTSGVPLSLFSNTYLGTNAWYHVVGIVKGTNAYIYLNGWLDAWTGLTGTPRCGNEPVRFAQLGSYGYFPGILDDVRVYNRALEPWEILTLATTTILDTDGDGLADYFEDRNGNGVVDTASGETDWLTSNSGLSGPAALQVFTPLN